MKIPTIKGLIERRILVNYIAEPDVVRQFISEPFSPKLYNGKAIVGICLIRLSQIRPKGFPAWIGISSENAAHRFAVEWQQNGETYSGVYIPRRDTSSKLNHWAGGRVFPGKHGLAKFEVHENDEKYQVAFQNNDGTGISLNSVRTERFPENSIFGSLENSSAFFQQGALGYTPGKGCYDGLNLKTDTWEVTALEVKSVQSSFFDDIKLFPEGSIKFDHALLMRNISHEWQSIGEMRNS